MRHLKSAVFVIGIVCAGAPTFVVAQTIDAPAASPAVRALAERLQSDQARAPAGPVDVGEEQIAALCGEVASAADMVEALILAGVDIFTAVRDTILACGRKGNAAEVAREAATRALVLRGEGARYLIDGAVVAAAAEIGRRLKGGEVLASGESQEQSRADRDLERERLERMMQKGLIDDEYRRYIDERRALAASDPSPVGDQRFAESGFDPARYDYGTFFLQALPVVEPLTNPGGVSGE